MCPSDIQVLAKGCRSKLVMSAVISPMLNLVSIRSVAFKMCITTGEGELCLLGWAYDIWQLIAPRVSDGQPTLSRACLPIPTWKDKER